MFRRIIVFTFLLINFISFSQEDSHNRNSIGVEIVGRTGLYSVFYNRVIYEKSKFVTQTQSHLSYVPGDKEGGLTSHIIPFFAMNEKFYLSKRFSLNLNLGVGLDVIIAKGNANLDYLSSASFGPMLETNFLTFGLSYVFFLKTPEYFTLGIYPHSIGFSMGVDF